MAAIISSGPRVNGLDSPPASPPAIPQRSPLRPRPKAIINAADMPVSFLTSPSITTLIEPEQKALPVRPESPITLSPLEDEPTSSNSSFTMSKRQHALLELLESERAYASDLALVRELHIPLALGHPVSLHTSPSNSSASSSRTMSTASDSSTSSLGPPMTLEDTKIIFNNIVELAVFSDRFCEHLEQALGSVVEGGDGEDAVGALFLRIIPDMAQPFKIYITRQRAADEHLQSLPKTPALEAYYAHTRSISTSISHAWDLHSLLIKPVQRLLKYPLLLSAIIEETPDSHPDKQNLKLARSKIEEIARNVNEERRRAEVVKGVLSSAKKSRPSASTVALVKMKSLKSPGRPADENEEAALVTRLSTELHRIELFAQQFARNVLDWAKSMSVVVLALRTWAHSFAKVIGLSEENTSEAFDAFLEVVEHSLMPLCVNLESVINEHLLKDLAHLLTTMGKPMKLIESMEEQEAMHLQLLNMNVSPKNRPPPALLEASSNYLALRAQLAKELPRYVGLMDRGLSCFIRKLADIQKSFYSDVRDRWGELWEMLRVDGEINAGAEETVGVWWARWGDVDHVLSSLAITNPKKIYQEPFQIIQKPPSLAPLKVGSSVHVAQMVASLDPPHSQRKKDHTKAAGVVGMLMSLEPAHSPNISHNVSSPYPLSPPRSRPRGRGSTSGSGDTRRSPHRRPSTDSLRSRRSKTRSPHPYLDFQAEPDFADYLSQLSISSGSPPANTSLTRMKSMPLRQTRSQGPISSPTEEVQKKPSFRRKLSDQLPGRRPSSASNPPSQHKPKTPSIGTLDSSDSLRSHPPSSFMQNHSQKIVSRSSQPIAASRVPSKYFCTVIHPFHPQYLVSYACPYLSLSSSYPFLDLENGHILEVLEEAGHPRSHPGLPIALDESEEEEDTLLLCRTIEDGDVGWALASFLKPLS